MTGGADRTIKLWNPFRDDPDEPGGAAPLLVQTFKGPHGHPVHDVALCALPPAPLVCLCVFLMIALPCVHVHRTARMMTRGSPAAGRTRQADSQPCAPCRCLLHLPPRWPHRACSTGMLSKLAPCGSYMAICRSGGSRGCCMPRQLSLVGMIGFVPWIPAAGQHSVLQSRGFHPCVRCDIWEGAHCVPCAKCVLSRAHRLVRRNRPRVGPEVSAPALFSRFLAVCSCTPASQVPEHQPHPSTVRVYRFRVLADVHRG